jgi:hypothetical protein
LPEPPKAHLAGVSRLRRRSGVEELLASEAVSLRQMTLISKWNLVGTQAATCVCDKAHEVRIIRVLPNSHSPFSPSTISPATSLVLLSFINFAPFPVARFLSAFVHGHTKALIIL